MQAALKSVYGSSSITAAAQLVAELVTHGEAQGLKQQLVSQHVHGQLLIAEAVHAGSASA
jgi:hypothetical protein